MQPDQADFLLNGLLLPTLRNEHRITKSVIEAIPLDKGDYRPDGISKSAMDLAWHTVSTEILFLEAIERGVFEFRPMPLPDTIKNSADLAGWYSEHFETHFEKLKALSNEQLTKVLDFLGMFQMPAVMYLNFLTSHTIHHRGQLSMYLRPVGAKVPAMYGESFDSAEARKAAH